MMIFDFKKLLTLFLSVISIVGVNAQEDGDSQALLSYIKHAMRFSLFYPQEKVYLHLDNTGYFKGETIWLKAYVTRVDTQLATDLSRVLYVELLNPSGDVVERRKLHIENGMAHGDIKVDSIMVTGFYEIRAFTRYMTNWGTNACFSRVIPIFKAPELEGDYSNPVIDKISYRHRLNDERLGANEDGNRNIVDLSTLGEKDKKAKAEKGKVKVHFYPEGGHSVKGLPTRIAFTVTDAEGMPMKTEVSASDAKGVVLITTQTDADGRGVFELSSADAATQLVVEQAEGGEKSFPLPTAEDEGCTMLVDVMDADLLHADVSVSSSLQGRKLGYVLMNSGNIVRCDTLTAQPHQRISFERVRLPEGVNQLTLFGSDGRILAERQFFIYPTSQQDNDVKVTPAAGSIKPCGKVAFTLKTAPNASLSFSAVDAKGYLNGASGNIRTWMLLASDLRGYIAHPEYYLESDDEAHRRATDLLMMVQGWRRYDWRLMTGQSLFEKYQTIESQLFLFGRLGNKLSKKKGVDNVWIEAKLFNHAGQVVEGTTKTDSLGNYVFSLPDISGEWNLSINTGVADKKGYWKDVDYFVGIDRHFSPEAKYVSPVEADYIPVDEKKAFKWTMTDEDEQWVSITHKNHVLKNVTVKAKGRVWDRTGWGNETSARMKSNIYYNCDEAADRIADEGQGLPGFCQWLKEKNSLFAGETSPTALMIAIPDSTDPSSENSATGRKIVKQFNDFDPQFKTHYDLDPPVGYLLFYEDGLTYKNRPIVWVVDNQFCTITSHRKRGDINIVQNDNSTNAAFTLPIGLDEVKSVYISEEIEGIHNHLLCGEIDQMNPVVLYVYTHRKLPYHQTGLRNTHFQGYNEPSTFQMEDYTKIPPMEDYRRTLFWTPDVKTDERGRATIEFFNNSSCNEMYISCEGMTEEGVFVAADSAASPK
ncbi:MAG: hypothetical protein IJP82_03030 [Bacteroidaceae bacterium]|nr:hypothetical protein [Bacteroidaceae bacterium]